MKDKIISSKLDGLLKEKNADIIFCGCQFWPHCKCFEEMITQSLLQKWLREKYNIFVQVEVDQTLEPKFVYVVIRYLKDKDGEWVKSAHTDFYGGRESSYSDLFYTYEEALEAGLEYSLRFI